jgi:predicted permease
MLISPGNTKYRDANAGLPFYGEVLRRARDVPGVELAAVADSLPPDRQGDADTFEIEGRALAAGEMNPVVSCVTAGPDYFQALGIPLVKGRYFTGQDHSGSAAVAIVSENFARRFFPNEDAIGKRIKRSGEAWMEIVGVTGNVKYLGLAVDTDPAYYMPFAQNYGSRMFLVVRSSGEAAGVAASLREEIQSIDRGVTLAQTGTMEQALRLSVAQPRFDTMLMALFAGIALLLAAAGVYGVIAYSVVQRTQEIGVRMALGAAQKDVLRMVVQQGVSLAALGIVIGLGGALVLTRFLRTMLFNTGATDAVTFAAAPAALMLVVLLATLLPALRASRVSPVVALRYE